MSKSQIPPGILSADLERIGEDSLPVAIVWETDADGLVTFISESESAYTGLSPEKLLGTGWMDTIHVADKRRISKLFKEAISLQQPFCSTYRKRGSRGNYRRFTTHAVPRYNSNGEFLGHNGFCLDISDTIAAQSELDASQRLMRRILDSSPFLTTFIDSNLYYRYANSRYAEFWNLSPGDIVGRNLREFVGPLFELVSEQISRTLEGETVSHLAEIPLPNGEIAWLEMSHIPAFDADDNVVGFYSFSNDITEQKLATSNWQESEIRSNLALSGSSIGVFEFDFEDADWVYAEHIEDLLGYERGSMQNSRAKIRSLIHPEDLATSESARAAANDGRESRQEIRIRNREGQYRWFRVMTRSVGSPDDGRERLAGTISDIHDLKLAQLRAADEVRRRDDFLAMLSHELRNPMASIVLSLDRLRQHDELPVDLEDVTEVMSRQAEQISSLLDDLLDVSRVTHGRIEFRKRSFNLNQLVEESVEGMQLRAHEADIELRTSIADEPMFLDGDRARIGQAICNLIDNAVKYTPAGGTITVGCAPNGDTCILQVRDTGAGIEIEDPETLFELFYQGEVTIHRAGGGLGVGLFMVRKIVNAHGGTISVQSDGAGCGSTFTIRLPAQLESAATKSGVHIPVKSSSKTIALVEDNRDVRNVLASLLKSQGMRVVEFADGETAEAGIRELLPDIALIDVGLPGKSGLELVRSLRSESSLNRTLMIALTGYGQSRDHELVDESGFDRHLVKPVRLDDLLEAFEGATDRQQSE